MKAILVVECQEKDIGKRVGYIPVKDGNTTYYIDGKDVSEILPMPLKRRSTVHWFNSLTNDKNDTVSEEKAEHFITHEYTEYDKGWNDCVEFVEGEENE